MRPIQAVHNSAGAYDGRSDSHNVSNVSMFRVTQIAHQVQVFFVNMLHKDKPTIEK